MHSLNDAAMFAARKYTSNPNVQENTKLSSFSRDGNVSTSYALLLDRSDTVNYPHTDPNGRLMISYVSLQVDRTNTSLGRMSIGVITRIDGTSADITLIRGLSFSKSGTDFIERAENFAPGLVNCEVVNGTTPGIVSGTKTLNEVLVNTSTPLSGPGGSATPAVGDIVITFGHTSGSAWFGAAGILYTMDKPNV